MCPQESAPHPSQLVARRLLKLAGLATLLAQTSSCGSEVAGSEAPHFEFVDVAAQAGINMRITSGDPRRWYIVESNGCGAAFLDYDGDGDQDLFVGNGAGLIYHDDGRRLEVVNNAKSHLYRNDTPKGGALTFVDVTEATGTGRSEWNNAVSVADPDNDGDPDLYLANFGADVFLRNDGGVYRDETLAAGLANPLWGTAAAFGDADNDGHLDLYVANYCLFDPESPPLEGRRNVIEGVEIGWGPEEENKQGANLGAPDIFFRGDGRGGFEEATQVAGLQLDKALCSYAALFSDVDQDGWQDILVANDLQPCNLFWNQGGGKFVDQAVERGFALAGNGNPTGAMGLMAGDFDADGDFDYFRSNFDLESNTLHVNDGAGRFADRTEAFGLKTPSMDRLGWGGAFFDADCDGDLDLLVANGHVMPQAESIGMSAWLQQSQLFEAQTEKDGRIRFQDATERSGTGLLLPRSARGAAFGDPDNDGDLDVVLVDLDARPRLLVNHTARRGRWLQVQTIGTQSNRDGYGSRVEVTAGGRTLVREMTTNQGLFSSHDPRLHFGLGEVEKIDRVVVRWPSGESSLVEEPPLDSLLTIREEPTR